jgi:hypothetical protein
MADPIKAAEIMNQLNMEGGKEPSAKARSTANDKKANPETAKKFESALEKARAEVSKISEQVKNEPKYTGKAYSDTGPRTGSNISGTFGSTGIPKTNRDLMKNNKAGGIIKSASNRADGIAQRGKTKGRIV